MKKDVIGWEGMYEVTDDGKVFSSKIRKGGGNLWLKQPLNGCGYHMVNLCKNGKCNLKRVHRLVAEAFIKNPNKYKCVNHKNGIKTDNRVLNLEWCSHAQNNYHAYKIGLKKPKFGSLSYNAILNDSKVIKIRSLYKAGVKAKELSKKYGVSTSCIRSIVSRRNWKHL